MKTWEEFKHLIIKHNPKSLCYNIQREAASEHITGLRLILPTVGKQYIFIDIADGNCLKKTGIKLHVDKLGTRYLKDEDIVEFVSKEVNRNDLQFHSYWTI